MEQQRSSSGATLSPRSPSSSQPFLSVSVSDPVKLGNGVQAYISYRVITKLGILIAVALALISVTEDVGICNYSTGRENRSR
ncbi:hypothetical protein TSUD_25420 [Trifolium subterraneum]|uniref:Uncharacterized protein n=1 Tax=Trifolium subterraneum TaxID=3900 RepID=A0A2Z6PKI8_TRISU|nr:hypothetical protein TSUD_25420 [Trifolium subterraneum]